MAITDIEIDLNNKRPCFGLIEALSNITTTVKASEEMVEIPPKDEVDANMIKRGFLKPRMRSKTISIEYKPRTME